MAPASFSSQYFRASSGSAGTSMPLLYQLANSTPRIRDPSGDSQNISEYWEVKLSFSATSLLKPVGFTPLPKAAQSIPASRSIWGACPMLPKESGKYPTLLTFPYLAASLIPVSRLRRLDSLPVSHSSCRIYQGPIYSLFSFTSFSTSSFFSGLTWR